MARRVKHVALATALLLLLFATRVVGRGPTPRFGTWIRLVSEPGFVSFRTLDSPCFGTRVKWSPEARKWFLGSGFWEVVSGKWFLGSGFLGSGFW